MILIVKILKILTALFQITLKVDTVMIVKVQNVLRKNNRRPILV